MGCLPFIVPALLAQLGEFDPVSNKSTMTKKYHTWHSHNVFITKVPGRPRSLCDLCHGNDHPNSSDVLWSLNFNSCMVPFLIYCRRTCKDAIYFLLY